MDTAQVARLLRDAYRLRRPANWGRAAPSALCWHALSVYALTAQGTYRYLPQDEALEPVDDCDQRSALGNPAYAEAPVVLVYVANLDQVHQAHAEEHGKCAGVDAERLVESLCERCGEEGLDTLAHGRLTRACLARALGLKPTERVVLAQAIGHPAEHRA